MKLKISEVAKEVGVSSKDIINVCSNIGIDAKSPNSKITPAEAQKVNEFILNPEVKKQEEPKKEEPKKEEVTIDSKKEVEIEEEKVQENPKTEENSTVTNREKRKRQRRKNKESLSSMLKKNAAGGGIKIVKKNKVVEKPKVVEKKEVKKDPVSVNPIPKKKPKKKVPVTSIEKGEELNLDMSIGNMTSLEENEVVLFDLSFNEIKMDLEEKRKPKPKPKGKNGNKHYKKRTLSKSDVKKVYKKEEKTSDEPIVLKEETRVYELASKIDKPLDEVLEKLKEFGEELDKNDFINQDVIETIAEEFEVNVKLYNPIEDFDYVGKYDEIEDDEKDLVLRAPIVTIMGHVDHGKTSLLDKIRNTKVTSGEAGGITQHIGAYMINKDGKDITFIDTPGHAAFTEMRARGAKVTDIVVIVVAADDGVMPQTKEAINHAKAAGVPIIIAINKMDKESANPEKVTTQLSELGIMPTSWGGEYEFVNVSAHTGMGIDELLEAINIQAEVMELKANPKRDAKAVVIESEIQKGRGAAATVVIQNGTLKKGDSIVCGTTFGRVRSLLDDMGKQLKSAKAGQPVQVFGLNEVPMSGDILIDVKNDKLAREYATKWKDFLMEKSRSKSTKATLEDLKQMMIEGNIKKLPVIIRADTRGSVEAIKGSLEKLKNDEVRVQVLQGEVGAITENDIVLAEAGETPAIILGFNVRPTNEAKNKAKSEGVDIRTYSIIYDLIDDVTDILSGMLSPNVSEEITGSADVREVFMVPKVGAIAGCMVTDGTIYRNNYARVIRDGVVIYDAKLSSLKRFKDDVKEVGKGFDCGIMVENYNDVKPGDVIESYKKIEKQATFN